MILAIAILVVAGAAIGWVAHKTVAINYKKRWKELSDLLAKGDDTPLTGGSRLVPTPTELKWTDKSGHENCIIFVLHFSDGKKHKIYYTRDIVGLTYSHPNFEHELAKYRKRAEAVQRAMDAV